MDLRKVKELALDISVSLEMTDVDTGAYIDAAKEKAALLIAEIEKPGEDANGIAVSLFNQEYVNDAEWMFHAGKAIQQYAESYHAKKQQDSCRRCLTELDELDRAEMLASLPEAPNA